MNCICTNLCSSSYFFFLLQSFSSIAGQGSDGYWDWSLWKHGEGDNRLWTGVTEPSGSTTSCLANISIISDLVLDNKEDKDLLASEVSDDLTWMVPRSVQMGQIVFHTLATNNHSIGLESHKTRKTLNLTRNTCEHFSVFHSDIRLKDFSHPLNFWPADHYGNIWSAVSHILALRLFTSLLSNLQRWRF